jgi:hypothetical protein
MPSEIAGDHGVGLVVSPPFTTKEEHYEMPDSRGTDDHDRMPGISGR